MKLTFCNPSLNALLLIVFFQMAHTAVLVRNLPASAILCPSINGQRMLSAVFALSLSTLQQMILPCIISCSDHYISLYVLVCLNFSPYSTLIPNK